MYDIQIKKSNSSCFRLEFSVPLVVKKFIITYYH